MAAIAAVAKLAAVFAPALERRGWALATFGSGRTCDRWPIVARLIRPTVAWAAPQTSRDAMDQDTCEHRQARRRASCLRREPVSHAGRSRSSGPIARQGVEPPSVSGRPAGAEAPGPLPETWPAGLDDGGADLGVAVDIGTTEIRTALWDRARRLCLGTSRTPNPQDRFGGDVLARLAAAAGSAAEAQLLAVLSGAAIAATIRELCVANGRSGSAVREVAIVGNTAMLALLTGGGSEELLEPRAWQRRFEFRFPNPQETARSWGLDPRCRLRVVQPLAGFVGSDLLAGVIATRLTLGPAGSLLLDFGANTEIALWDGTRLWATSAAGGPAFEWCGIRCGMPAQPGAIRGVRSSPDATAFELEVVGDIEPKGMCASGLVDAVAVLLSTGRLSGSGRFAGASRARGLMELTDRGNIVVTHQDIDALQRAKAGVAAATKSLLAEAGLTVADIGRVCVAGAFGEHLDVANARAIGLLPPVDDAIVELCGNAALAGCGQILCGEPDAGGPVRLPDATVVNMSFRPEFESIFVRNLRLGPWPEAVAITAGGTDD